MTAFGDVPRMQLASEEELWRAQPLTPERGRRPGRLLGLTYVGPRGECQRDAGTLPGIKSVPHADRGNGAGQQDQTVPKFRESGRTRTV
jgi:hypothetical protein